MFMLFDRVFRALVETKQQIHDDTLLDKLAELLTSSASTQDTMKKLMTEGACMTYLCALTTEQHQAPDRFILGLRIATNVAIINWDVMMVPAEFINRPSTHGPGSPFTGEHHSPDHFSSSLLSALWNAAQKPHYWQDGGVREAWLGGLLKCLQKHPSNALNWVMKMNYLDTILELYHGETSMFVRQSVEHILAVMLMRSHKEAAMVDGSPGTSSHNIFNIILDAVDQGMKGSSFVISCSSLKILEALAVGLLTDEQSAQLGFVHQSKTGRFYQAGTSVDLLQSVMEKVPLVDFLCAMVLDSKTFITAHQKKAMLNHLTLILSAVINSKLLQDTQQCKLLNLPCALLASGDFDLAMRTAAWLSHWFEESNGRPLHVYVQLPQMLALNREHESISNEEWHRLMHSLKKQPVSLISASISLMTKVQRSKLPLGECLADLHGLLAQASGEPQRASAELNISSVVGNHRLQKNICDSIIHLQRSSPASDTSPASRANSDQLYQTSALCLHMLQKHQQSPVLTEAVYQVVLLCLSQEVVASNRETHFLQLDLLCEVLCRHLCSIHWEVRDTASEVIIQLLQLMGDVPAAIHKIKQQNIVKQVWQSVRDEESYVRAAALRCMLHASRISCLWSDFTLATPQIELVQKVIYITDEDTEAFARRAALIVLCAWCQDATFQSSWETIQLAINKCITDMDWEVKLQVLNHWEKQIEDITSQQKPDIPPYAVMSPNNTRYSHDLASHEKLERLSYHGCYCILIQGLKDYDQSVQYHACSILLNLKHFCNWSNAGNCEVNRNETANIVDETVQLSQPALEFDPPGSLSLHDCLSFICSFDLDKLAATLSQSTDEYMKNSCMLLEDILVALDHNDEEYAVDCY